MADSPRYENVSSTIEQFRPNAPDDPMFDRLRRLFVDSFEQFYRNHLNEMNFESVEQLRQWLNDSFDQERDALSSGDHRCLLLSRDDPRALLIFRVDDEQNVSLLRLLVRSDLKRRGFGTKLFEEFRQSFAPTTNFYFTFRRINEPALKFFVKHGATVLPANDPSIYLTLHFNATVEPEGSSPPEVAAPPNLQCCSLF